MGTDVRAVADDLAVAVETVDAQMSNWRADSDLSRLNDAAPGLWVSVPDALARVLTRACEIGRRTGGAFNIAVGDCVAAWGFGPNGQRGARPPVDGHACRSLDDVLEIDSAERRVRRHAVITFDLCGIAKGFGVDELARVLEAHRIDSWLVGIDGEMRARGGKPDGTAWTLAIEAPEFDRRSAMGVIELTDRAIATSGDYRQWRDVGGERVSHTIDPRSGAPLRNGVAAVTVIAPDCTSADAYATALMVLGPEAGAAIADQEGLDALFVQREPGVLRSWGTGCFAAPPA
jgi:thiamine biosynthesis lipoprotein